MGRECSTYGGEGGAYRVLVGKPEGRPLANPNPGVDERIIFKWKWVGGSDWIDLAQGRDGWRPVVNEVMNLRVS
jgi:hypothetical protein